MLKKILTRGIPTLMLVAVSIVGQFAMSPAAQAWGYCNNARVDSNLLNIYDNQGYCGEQRAYTGSIGVCHNLGAANDWAGSVNNRRPYKLSMFNRANCDGSDYNWYSIPGNSSHPDLYGAPNLGNKMSSFRWDY